MTTPSRIGDHVVSLSEGDVVAGRYLTGHLIGRGGMGAVFEARDLRTGRPVALKVLYAEYASEPAWRRRFIREARTAAAIRHPNIVDVLDVEVDGPLPFIAMELLRGETLGELVAREQKLSLVEAAHLLAPVCSAVHAAHGAGIVHRDLKPENIFLASDGGRETPYVLDFGIAKVTPLGHATEVHAPALTQTGAMMGTPHFMAPEQMLNEDDVDHRVDVWALGVILFYALTGERPWPGLNLAQILKTILTSTHQRLDALLPELPRDVVDVVHACLSVKREARPDGVDQIAAVLAPHAGVAPPVRMHRSTRPPPIKRPSLSVSTLEGDATEAIVPQARAPRAPRVEESGGRSIVRRTSTTRLSVRPTDTETRVVFGMVPQRDDAQTRLLLGDLCAYLAKQIDMPVVPHRSPSIDALASALGAGRVHVAWTGALQVLLSEHLTDMVPLLSAVREGAAFYHSVIFTPARSAIRDLADARGRSIAWVAPTSAAGYVVPRLSLARRGIAVEGYFAHEMFAGSHAKATQALANGEVELAATYAIFEDGDPARPLVKSGYRTFDPSLEVRVLDTAGPIPSDLIVASPRVPVKVTRAISQALLRIAADKASKAIMTDLIGADDFLPFTPAVIREVRALVDVARASGALGDSSW